MGAKFVIPVIVSILILGGISASVDVLGAAVKTVEELCSKGGGPKLILCAAIDTITAENTALTADNAAKTTTITNLQNDLAAAQDDLLFVQFGLEDAIREIGNLQNDNTVLTQRVADLEAQIAASQGADLSGIDLSAQHLEGRNLSGVDLSGAFLFRTDFSGANLSGANLSGAELTGAEFSFADLSGADFTGSNLQDARGGPFVGCVGHSLCT